MSQFQQILNNYVNFDFSTMKKLWDVAFEKLSNIKGRYGNLGSIFMDVSHTLEMAICVVNQLTNYSYCQPLYIEQNTLARTNYHKKARKKANRIQKGCGNLLNPLSTLLVSLMLSVKWICIFW